MFGEAFGNKWGSPPCLSLPPGKLKFVPEKRINKLRTTDAGMWVGI